MTEKKIVEFSDPLHERALTDLKIDYVYLNGTWTISAIQEDGVFRTEIKDPDTGKSVIIVMPRYVDSLNLARTIEASKEPKQEMGKNALDIKSLIFKNKVPLVGFGSGIIAFALGWFGRKLHKNMV